MPMITKGQLGTKLETTYGSAVTVDRFFAYREDTMQEQRGRVDASQLRPGQRVQRSTHFQPYSLGASGNVVFIPESKGFAWWLRFIMGASSTGTVSDSVYPHTGTLADLASDVFTMQINRPFAPSDTDQAFTYAGCKVTSGELACSVDEPLVCTVGVDAASVSTATSLASATYPAGTVEPFTFVGATVTVGGTAYELQGISVSVDNTLNVDRRHLRASIAKKEPLENGYRQVAWTLTGADFEDLTTYNRFRSDTASGALAAVVATFQAPTLAGASTYPRIVVTIDEARFDTADGMGTTVDGTQLVQTYSGIGMFDGTNSPVTVVVSNTDATA